MKKIASVVIGLTLTASAAIADGKADYAALGCAGCHGAAGISASPIWPNLAGQKAAYTVKQLKAFQSGARKDASMAALAALAKGKEQAIADYLAGL
ncbi:MAG: c-type cytochrome [Candidatus Thioglobus sp.]|nr:c-type cytochrome [Candidatus Thioglobus sp.]